jgi:dihydrofolate reductase
MGRDTYDAVRRMGDWPYPGKPAVVLSHRPLDAAPPGVERRSGDLTAVVAELEGRGLGRIWIEGGGRLVRDLMALGRVDVLEMAVIPVVLSSSRACGPGCTARSGWCIGGGRGVGRGLS